MKKVLILEDEENIRSFVVINLTAGRIRCASRPAPVMDALDGAGRRIRTSA